MSRERPFDHRNSFIRTGLAIMTVALLAPAVVRAALPNEKLVPRSLGMQLKGGDCEPETLDQIKSLGVRCVRKGIYWNHTEKVKGEYDFAWSDEFVKEVCEKRGFTLLFCLFNGNKLYEDPKPGGIRTEAGRKGFAGFAAALAERYKDHDIMWEIWNEPNVRTFWGRHGKSQHNSDEYAGEYTALVKEVAPAMLAVDPDCCVIAGSVSNLWSASYNYTRYCFDRGIHESGIKGWSVHPYSVPVDSYPEAYATVRKILDDRGAAHLPILNSERGFPTKKAEGWAGGDPADAGSQLQYHAWHFVRQYLVDVMCDVKLTIWYQWHGGGFSMADRDGAERPACEASRVLVKQLGEYTFAKRLATASKKDFVLLFETGDGRRKLAAWTAPVNGKSPDSAKVHDISIPVKTVSPTARTCDIYGATASTMVASGMITISLSGSPQYVDLNPGASGARRIRSDAAAPATLPARPIPTDVGTSMFDELLQNRTREEITAGRKPCFFYSAARVDLIVRSVDEDGRLDARVKRDGTAFTVRWRALSLADRTSLATAMHRASEDIDNAIAAFFLMALGDDERGREHLARSGALKGEVLGAFE